MNLSKLVQLTSQFLEAAKAEISSRGGETLDLRDALSADQQERLQELKDEADELNADRIDKIARTGLDSYQLDVIADQLRTITLKIHDIFMEGAQNLLGREYLAFLAPDELRSASAAALLTLNNAKTISALSKNTLQ